MKEKGNMSSHNYKLAILGDTGTGKSSFMYRLLSNCTCGAVSTFMPAIMPTACIEIHSVNIDTPHGKFHGNIYDFSGQELSLSSIPDVVYEITDAALIFYDPTLEKTVRKAACWEEKYRKLCPNKPIIYVANMADPTGEKQMIEPSISISSRTNYNILAPITEVCRILNSESEKVVVT